MSTTRSRATGKPVAVMPPVDDLAVLEETIFWLEARARRTLERALARPAGHSGTTEGKFRLASRLAAASWNRRMSL